MYAKTVLVDSHMKVECGVRQTKHAVTRPFPIITAAPAADWDPGPQ